MKQLTAVVLVAVVAVVGRVVEGTVYTQCQLVAAITSKLPNIGQNSLDKIVCHAAQTSQFDSSFEGSMMVGGQNWKTYGIFQISHHFCDGQDKALSICDGGCNKYLDDDITNDITCVDNIKNAFLSNPVGAPTVLQQIISQLFSPYCQTSSDGAAAGC